METRSLENMFAVPYFIKAYCENRKTQVIEYLTDERFAQLFRTPGVLIKPIEADKETGRIRCLVTRQVLPLTVLTNPMLRRAAELEWKTYRIDPPMSLQEARWILTDEYPETNCVAQPYAVKILIRENKGCFKLCLSDVVRIANERRSQKLCTV